MDVETKSTRWNSCRHIALTTVAKTLTPEQEGALLGASARTGLARHTATVLALNTAMGKDETRLLRWSQVDFE